MPTGLFTADQLQSGYQAYPQYISQESRESEREREIDRPGKSEGLREIWKNPQWLTAAKPRHIFSCQRQCLDCTKSIGSTHLHWEKMCVKHLQTCKHISFSARRISGTGLWFDRGGDTLWKGSEYDRGVSYTASPLPLFETAARNSSTSQEFNTL